MGIFVVLAIGFTFDNATAQSGNGPATAEDKIVTAAGHMLPGISPKGSKAPKSNKKMKEMKEMRGSKAPKANKKGAKLQQAQVAKKAATGATTSVALIAMIGFVAVLAVKKLRGDAVAAVADEVDEHSLLLGLSDAAAAPSEAVGFFASVDVSNVEASQHRRLPCFID